MRPHSLSPLSFLVYLLSSTDHAPFAYGFHVPPRISAAETAEPLKEGAPAEAVKILYDNGQFTPPQYTNAMDTIMQDALAHIVKEGAVPADAVATAAQQCEEELARVLGG